MAMASSIWRWRMASGDTVSILLGTGPAALGRRPTSAPVVHPVSVAVGDFNGDGKLDLAVANQFTGQRLDSAGHGTRHFGAKTDFGTGDYSNLSRGGRFQWRWQARSGGGELSDSDTVSILLGTGTGSFGPKTDFGTGSQSSSQSRWAISMAMASSIWRWRTQYAQHRLDSAGHGHRQLWAKTDFATGNCPVSVAVGDFNGDGKLDLAVANFGNATPSRFCWAEAPAALARRPTSHWHRHPFSRGGRFQWRWQARSGGGEFDHDNVSILLGNGSGQIWGGELRLGRGSTSISVAVGDFNGDGKLDLAVANFNSNTVSVLLNNVNNVTIFATDDTATEAGPTTGTFRVTRTGSTASSLTVFYTLGGMAVSGTDYTLAPAPSSVTIPAGASSRTITVTPINDVVMEGNETVVATLSPRPNYAVGSPGSATVTIVSDERVTISATDSTATESGPTTGASKSDPHRQYRLSFDGFLYFKRHGGFWHRLYAYPGSIECNDTGRVFLKGPLRSRRSMTWSWRGTRRR